MHKKYIQNPHDAFVKKVFSHKEHAEDLKNYLPQDICRLIDFDSLTLIKDSLFGCYLFCLINNFVIQMEDLLGNNKRGKNRKEVTCCQNIEEDFIC